MNNRALLALLGSVVTLAFAFPVTVHAQAAAESALTNALSSSAAVKGGSALGHALNQGSLQLGARIQERTSSPVPVGAQQKTSMAGLRNQAPGSLAGNSVRTGSSPGASTISIQGGQGACVSAASIDCHGQKSAPKSGPAEDKYKSFVTLSFPK